MSLRLLTAAVAAASLACALPAAAQQKIKIGFITTMTGPQGVIGKHMKDSVELAIEQLGGKMGGVPQLKVGSFARSERMAKWNEGLRIEEALGGKALPYPARRLFRRA